MCVVPFDFLVNQNCPSCSQGVECWDDNLQHYAHSVAGDFLLDPYFKPLLKIHHTQLDEHLVVPCVLHWSKRTKQWLATYSRPFSSGFPLHSVQGT